ncbi:Lactate dehydrogenase [Duganella sacchari]|uniref:Lactate dehydrogenase n=1 Tax=Duganella sacchari TaxID=551987 RepID=A0A1M7R7M2_9BURK|nr:2-hydroxyacid dehydrogenase [Duganella sacchari]SHN42141.1 Lactate dehydrogenase [Duganella sacchari]
MELLLLIEMAAPFVADLQLRWPLARLTPQHADAVRIVITNGSTGLSAQQMDALPALQLVCCYGAGYENIDLQAAQQRGITVTHAPGVNNATVADHAMALMLSSARALPLLDRAVKAGQWLGHRTARPAVHGKRLGIVGMGNIGALIARRAAGFDMEVAYHARHPRPDIAYRYVGDVLELARDSDYLMLACPGGPATRHLVNKEVLDALGPQGFLVNIARGSVVDTTALIEALQQKRIAGAALDVIENEPAIPPEAAQLDTLILTPHISGRSPEAQQAQHDALLYNIRACLEGQPLRHVLTLS